MQSITTWDLPYLFRMPTSETSIRYCFILNRFLLTDLLNSGSVYLELLKWNLFASDLFVALRWRKEGHHTPRSLWNFFSFLTNLAQIFPLFYSRLKLVFFICGEMRLGGEGIQRWEMIIWSFYVNYKPLSR